MVNVNELSNLAAEHAYVRRCKTFRRVIYGRLTLNMQINVTVNGKSEQITPSPTKKATSLEEIQTLLKYDGPNVSVGDVHVDTLQPAQTAE
jgi:hypothetical protein